MKKITILSFMLTGAMYLAQVGVNTANPESTLDITAKASQGTTTNPEGLLIPRVDRERAQSMTNVATSTLVYVQEVATGTQTGSAVNIDAIGYYYFDGTAWTKLNSGGGSGGTNIYNADGTLTANRKVSQADKTLAFDTNITNGFSVAGNTVSVDGANSRLGIGTDAPTAKLEVNSGAVAGAIKIVDGTQAEGRVLTSDINGVGTWQSMTSDVRGSEIKKIKYEGSGADNNQTVQIGPVEFRIRNTGGGSGLPEMRFTSAVATNTIVTYHTGQYWAVDGYAYRNINRIFTSANWSTWQDVAISSTDTMSAIERNQVWLSIQNTTDIYVIDFIILQRSPGNYIYSITATKY